MGTKHGLTDAEFALVRQHIEHDMQEGVKVEDAISSGVKIGEGLIQKRLQQAAKQLSKNLQLSLIKVYLLKKIPQPDPMEVFYQKDLTDNTADSSSNIAHSNNNS